MFPGRARQMLYGAIEAESADLAERQSLPWMWNEITYDGPGVHLGPIFTARA